jgi:pimeloyl-ACP methyl ester carboxylesterase
MDSTSTAAAPDLLHVTSKDGTDIAIERSGSGPAVILVSGGSTDRMSNAGLAAQLAGEHAVYNFDRRGRGDSGDTLPYAVEREIEDIEAVLQAAGGRAALYGSSSGAGLAFEAALRLPGITHLVMWEPPYFVDPAARPPADQVATYDRLLAEGRRGEMAEYFMSKVVGLPPEFVAFAKTQPFWASQEKIAHTLAYDATVMGDYSPPIERARGLTVPTIILTGGASFPFFHETARVLVGAIPDARHQLLEGQEHNVDPAVLGAAIVAFLAA